MTIICGDCMAVLPTLPADSVHCVVTSVLILSSDDGIINGPGQCCEHRLPALTDHHALGEHVMASHIVDSRGRFIKGFRYSPATEFKPGQHWRKPQVFRDREWLLQEYVASGRSAGDIAAQFGVKPAAILFWLRKHGIARRSTSQARAIKHWGASGPQNPMYGVRGQKHHNWKGGSTPYRQSVYSTSEWGQFARSIFARDRVCLLCGSTGTRHIHHIVTVAEAPLLVMDERNVMLLCEKCHRRIQGKERRHAKRLFRVLERHLQEHMERRNDAATKG